MSRKTVEGAGISLRTSRPLGTDNFDRMQKGFRQPVVNQAFWVLRVMLDIAVEKMVIIETPFAVSSVLHRSLYASGQGDRKSGGLQKLKPVIPSRPDMARILAEIRRVPENFVHFQSESRPTGVLAKGGSRDARIDIPRQIF